VHTTIQWCASATAQAGETQMENKATENQTPEAKKKLELANVKLALTYGIMFGIGVVSGWYLTVSGFFG